MALDDLVIRIKATTEGLQAGLDDASKQLAKFDATASQKLMGATKALGALGVAAIAAGGALAIHLVSHALESAAALDNMSKQLGISVEELAKLHYAAAQVGVQAEGVNAAIRRMGLAMEQAGDYTGPAAQALHDLGIDIKTIRDLHPDEQFKILADAIGHARDQSEKMRIATQLFGREGGKMVALFNEGREGIDRYGKKAEALGLVLSTLEVEKLHRAQDALEDIEKIVDGLGNRLAVVLAPLITMASEQFVEWAARTHAVQKAVDFLVETYWVLVKVAGVLMKAASASWSAIESMVLDVTAAVLRFASDIQYGFHVMAVLAERVGAAIADTFEYAWDKVKEGMISLKVAFGSVVQAIGEMWATTLFKIAEGMRAAGIKGADLVESAANGIAAATGGLTAKYEAELKKQTDATEKAADAMGKSWATINDPVNREENASDRAAGKVGKKAGEADADLQQKLGDDPIQNVDDLRKQLDETKELKDKANKKEETDHLKHLNILEKQDQQAGQRLQALWNAGFRGRLQMAGDLLGQLSSLMDTHSRKAFEIGKAAALAEAVIKGYQAAVSAWAAGMSVGGPYAPAIAAAYTAASLVQTGTQIAKISSMSFGGGSSSGGGGGGGGGGDFAAAGRSGNGDGGASSVGAPARTGVILHMPDDALMDGQGFRRLIDKLNEATADGAQLGKVTVR